jgi:hypothetical protein
MSPIVSAGEQLLSRDIDIDDAWPGRQFGRAACAQHEAPVLAQVEHGRPGAWR